jgi:hypothetical protein
MNKKTVWNGRYKEISWEIVNWKIGEEQKDAWNSYLYLWDSDKYPNLIEKLWSNDRQISEYGGRIFYYPKDILENLPWHGGQTFYHQGIDNEHKYIHIGDDYLHLHDDEMHYNVEYVFDNIKLIIDVLIASLEVKLNL